MEKATYCFVPGASATRTRRLVEQKENKPHRLWRLLGGCWTARGPNPREIQRVANRLSTQVPSGSRCLSPVEQTLLPQVLRTLGLTGCILYCPSGERITEYSARSTKWIERPMFAISAPAGVVTPPRPRRRDSCPLPRACSISWYGVEPSTSVRVDARRGRIPRMDQDSGQRCDSAMLLTYTVWTNIFSNTKSTNH